MRKFIFLIKTKTHYEKKSNEAPTNNGFIAFINERISYLQTEGLKSAAKKLRTTKNSFLNFYGKEDIPFSQFDSELMVKYSCSLSARGLCKNSISFYMRTLRITYNVAVEQGLTTQVYPFKRVYTGIDHTRKRAISDADIRNICHLDLSSHPKLEFARDLFILSFMLRGMSFVDMAFLKHQDIANGILTYHRRKTKQLLRIRWESDMQAIVDKYDTGNSPYLLPIIKDVGNNELRQYDSSLRLVNKHLHKIGKMLSLSAPLTTYVARHSWASIAKSKNTPISEISEALGHDNEKTTLIYLSTLDTTGVDDLNKMLIDLII